jgi:hypothetical protein
MFFAVAAGFLGCLYSGNDELIVLVIRNKFVLKFAESNNVYFYICDGMISF